MKPAKPFPVELPFLSLFTPTFRRPMQLNACLASVGRQTLRDEIEQIVYPDHTGYGVAGSLYGRLAVIAPTMRGRYINFLCDDDTLADERVVERLKKFAEANDWPEVIVVRVVKGGLNLPLCDPTGEPQVGKVDLTSYIVRNDVWHAHVGDYGLRYEGDYDHALAMWNAGRRVVFCDLLFAIGKASNGRPEGDVV